MPSIRRGEGRAADVAPQMYRLILKRGTKGVLQSVVWKDLGLTSREGSRIAKKLEKRGMVRRERVLEHGRWTYRLIPLRFPVSFRAIENIPCVTCIYEKQCRPDGVISPVNCPPELEGRGLADWVLGEYREARAALSNSSKKVLSSR